MTPRLVGLLPMKGHSERVPGKNLRLIAGRPLYHWIVDTLLAAESVDEVVVDTDSDLIANDVAKHFPDVRVHMRPERLHGDFVAMHDIVTHLASAIDGDEFLQTHSTNPLLRPGTIDAAVAAYRAPGAHDSLMGVTAWQTRFYRRDGTPVNHDPGNLIRTQDLPPMLEENSNLYIAARDLIAETGSRVGQHPLLFEIDRAEAMEIDVELDFLMVEWMLERPRDA